ncbi:MAG: NADH-quinone oxidoreductase subunit J [Candidatus Caldarchaeum sp.]|nr:NADH-quinone oxidoreductase subunit J [Candidatus Caldarchaeum sp.]MCX8201336.1 NADH-quinone oxidoreductase subunit J [Candidatus Caldarchaeum sp.]MDW8063768.1 NADH-quinone oxidoreductase subunit J [Candidatus Caldarchaeum sp.]MDW8435793.1 NADH-quinone oxidoreductase subunit J [Candidatus Caldarchaeum sp.]
MTIELLELALLGAAVFFAILAVEQSKLVRSVIGLLGYTATLGILFLVLGAYPIAILQLLVYAGGIVALFIFVILLTRGVEE